MEIEPIQGEKNFNHQNSERDITSMKEEKGVFIKRNIQRIQKEPLKFIT